MAGTAHFYLPAMSGAIQRPSCAIRLLLPSPVEQFITESTYGNAQHGPIEQVGPQLLDAVQYCIAT